MLCAVISVRVSASALSVSNDLMSLRIDSRKNRSSSTTDTNDVFGICFRQFARTAMRAAPNNVVASTCEFHNVRKDTAGCNASGP